MKVTGANTGRTEGQFAHLVLFVYQYSEPSQGINIPRGDLNVFRSNRIALQPEITSPAHLGVSAILALESRGALLLLRGTFFWRGASGPFSFCAEYV